MHPEIKCKPISPLQKDLMFNCSMFYCSAQCELPPEKWEDFASSVINYFLIPNVCSSLTNNHDIKVKADLHGLVSHLVQHRLDAHISNQVGAVNVV